MKVIVRSHDFVVQEMFGPTMTLFEHYWFQCRCVPVCSNVTGWYTWVTVVALREPSPIDTQLVCVCVCVCVCV